MNARFNLLPDERFAAMRTALVDRMALIGKAITPDNFSGACTPMILGLMRDAFKIVGATEGSVWLADAAHQNLVVAHNTGPAAEKLFGFQQPLNKGLISAVYASQQAMAENEVYKNAGHDSTLNKKLSQLTYAMIAVPFYFLNECRGVVSCVQLMASDAEQPPPGFNRTHLQVIQTTASVMRELIDGNLLQITVGWKNS